MDKPENQARMADAKQQLEKTRGDVQKAAEALEKETPSQALASGARAQKELQQLRDDFRKKNSSQFTEEMRQMRNEARQLAEKQEEVGKEMESLGDKKQKTLTDSGKSKELADQLQQQRSGLTNLLENMRNVSDKAETVEPLLAKQLYETLRKSSQGQADNSLTMSSELLKRSFNSEAGQFEQKARGEINELKQGVEKAAESVLGDDVESLRLAKRELESLSKQIEDEMARAEGQQSRTNGAGRASAQSDRQRGEASRNGQRQDPEQAGQQGEQTQQGQGQAGNQSDQENAQGESARQRGQGDQSQQAQNGQQQQGGQPSQQGKQGQPGQQGEKGQEGQQPGEGEQGQQSQNQQGKQGQQGQGQGQQPGQQGQQAQQGKGQQGQQGEGQKGQQGEQGQQRQGQGQQQGQQGQGQQGQGQGQGRAQQAQRGQQPGKGPGGGPADKNQEGQLPQQQANAPQQGGRAPQGANNGGASGGGERTKNFEQRRFFDSNPSGQEGRGETGPLTGQEYTNWSDRLRDVQEMIDLPELRNEVARVLDRARAMRSELRTVGGALHARFTDRGGQDAVPDGEQ